MWDVHGFLIPRIRIVEFVSKQLSLYRANSMADMSATDPASFPGLFRACGEGLGMRLLHTEIWRLYYSPNILTQAQ